jgi:hypothetical protein
MNQTPSRDELSRRIAALLNTRHTGQAVADFLQRQQSEQDHRAAIANLRARRLDHRVETAYAYG